MTPELSGVGFPPWVALASALETMVSVVRRLARPDMRGFFGRKLSHLLLSDDLEHYRDLCVRHVPNSVYVGWRLPVGPVQPESGVPCARRLRRPG